MLVQELSKRFFVDVVKYREVEVVQELGALVGGSESLSQ